MDSYVCWSVRLTCIYRNCIVVGCRLPIFCSFYGLRCILDQLHSSLLPSYTYIDCNWYTLQHVWNLAVYHCRKSVLIRCFIRVYYTHGDSSKYFIDRRRSFFLITSKKFSWIFLLGIQHEASVLRSFSDLNHNRFHSRRYSNGNAYQRDASNHIFVNNTMADLTGPNYPAPLPTQASYPMDSHDRMVSIPMYNSSPNQSTIFLSPHSDYLIPVTAIHNCKFFLFKKFVCDILTVYCRLC